MNEKEDSLWHALFHMVDAFAPPRSPDVLTPADRTNYQKRSVENAEKLLEETK